ncbi:MAG: DciA family protein [Planctomycetaceae bacterium]
MSELFALKGYGNTKGDAQLADAWATTAGERIASMTTVMGVNRGVLQVGVSSAAMLGELASFHKGRLVGDLQTKFPALKLKGIKFRLRGDLAK